MNVIWYYEFDDENIPTHKQIITIYTDEQVQNEVQKPVIKRWFNVIAHRPTVINLLKQQEMYPAIFITIDKQDYQIADFAYGKPYRKDPYDGQHLTDFMKHDWSDSE